MDRTLTELVDRNNVIDTLVELFVATDERAWARVQQCFADEVTFDMTTLGSGEPVTLTPGQITEAWDDGLEPIEHIHHQVGNFQIELAGDEAAVSCHGVALHHRAVASGRDTRRFVGTYDFHLVRESSAWRIDLFRFRLKFLDGNLDLHGEDPAVPH